jgi:hypothetical protein
VHNRQKKQAAHNSTWPNALFNNKVRMHLVESRAVNQGGTSTGRSNIPSQSLSPCTQEEEEQEEHDEQQEQDEQEEEQEQQEQQEQQQQEQQEQHEQEQEQQEQEE